MDIEIINCLNGFLVIEVGKDGPYRVSHNKWVAESVDGLAKLVTELQTPAKPKKIPDDIPF